MDRAIFALTEQAMNTLTLPPDRLRVAWGFTVLGALPVVFSLPVFFHYLAARKGIVISDPLLAVLPSVDVSVPLFLFLYGVVAMVIVGLSRYPMLFLRTAQAYVLLLVLRMLTMALVPLDQPPGFVALNDPISVLFYPGQKPFSKDLFFSGHTATMFLFYLAAPWRIGRPLLLVATMLVGLAVLVQHVHWTVDVLAAPFFAWLAWWLSGRTVARTLGGQPRALVE
jgi:membrane-associated phospholipid phosphatase